MSKGKWSDTVIDKITDALALNQSKTELAKTLQCSVAVLNKVIDEFGIRDKINTKKEELVAELGIDRYFYLREMKSMYHEARSLASFGDARGCLNDLAKATGIIEQKTHVQVDGTVNIKNILDKVSEIEAAKPLVDILAATSNYLNRGLEV